MNTVGIVNLKHFNQSDFKTYFGHIPGLVDFCILWQTDGASYLTYLSYDNADMPSGGTADTFKQIKSFYKAFYTDGDREFHLLTPYELTQI